MAFASEIFYYCSLDKIVETLISLYQNMSICNLVRSLIMLDRCVQSRLCLCLLQESKTIRYNKKKCIRKMMILCFICDDSRCNTDDASCLNCRFSGSMMTVWKCPQSQQPFVYSLPLGKGLTTQFQVGLNDEGLSKIACMEVQASALAPPDLDFKIFLRRNTIQKT